ncbi:MAG TPA: phenylalanine--tRNA ligase subunit alpha [Bryobacteraceae bacterium]|nr:phenylalanine--tRNA ligase subunit alpha [Bryobacteraceae bacterium]
MQSIQELVERALAHIAQAESLAALEQARVQYVGKSGELTAQMKLLGSLAPEERKPFGQAVNAAKNRIEEAIEQRRAGLQETAKPAGPELDVTLPGRRRWAGRVHPMTATAETMKKILMGLGFSYDDYPDIESEYYNFDALNTPAWHPARDMHDTFYVGQGQLLRTHTTAFQARVMRASGGQVPIRAMTTGRCYRADDIDASHYPIFQQLDVFAVGRKLSMSDLRWTLTELAKGLFGPETKLRFRPSYFPFTTPSAEVDVSCVVCKQKGCALCSRTGWLEVLGSGMMRPEVLRAGGLDPEKYQGFAFGMGVDRTTMLRHQINDIRLLYDNEEAFLRQF